MGVEIIYIVLIIMAVLIGVIIGFLIARLRSIPSGQGYYVPQYYSQSPTMTASAPTWHIEIRNATLNQFFVKDFSGRIVLGRSTPAKELFWQIKVGNDMSISREQCLIYERGGMLVIENLSMKNGTILNGYQLNRPFMLTEGSQIIAGRSILYVDVLRRVG